MAHIDNRTGAPHFWFEQTGPSGERLDVLVLRATFDFAENGEPIILSDAQTDIVLCDVHLGPVETDPMRAVLGADADLVLYKPGTDIVISGNACAPGRKASASWFASIAVGPVMKVVQIFGPRAFRNGLFGWRLCAPVPVSVVPLDYRLAFGGCIDVPAEFTADRTPGQISFAGNPAGTGWLPNPAAFRHLPKSARKYVKQFIKEQRILRAPQFDSPTRPLRKPFQDNGPQGFGAIARWWQPRVSRQGTYDNQWRNTRYPLLPADFDSGYYQSAPADMVCKPHLKGAELITLNGLLPETRSMRLPGWRVIAVVTRASGDSSITFPILDTVRLDLDSHKVSIVWRAHFDYDDPVVNIAVAATLQAINFETEPAASPSAGEVEA